MIRFYHILWRKTRRTDLRRNGVNTMARNIYTDWGRVPLLLTLEEAGLLLRVTPECVRVLCVKGKLPAMQVGKQWRVDKKGLMQMIGGESA